MKLRPFFRTLCASATIGIALAGAAIAQQRPSAGTLAYAKELVELKGGMKLFDPLVSGVIEYHRNLFMQTNPNLGRDLSEVAQRLQAEYAPRRAQLEQEIVLVYARHFTEQELKDALAFYRSPLGRKLVAEEPKALDESMKKAKEWSDKLAEEIITKFRAEMRKKGHNLI